MRIEPDPVAVGRDIDSYCTRCRMDLAHTIIAMVGDRVVQVQCNTCGSTHRYRAPKTDKHAPQGGVVRKRQANGNGESVTKSRVRQTRAVPKTTMKERFEDWQRIVGDVTDEEGRAARSYNMREAFEEEELIRHPKFGLGRVTKVEHDGKIVVLFRDGEKRLVAHRGASVTA